MSLMSSFGTQITDKGSREAANAEFELLTVIVKVMILKVSVRRSCSVVATTVPPIGPAASAHITMSSTRARTRTRTSADNAGACDAAATSVTSSWSIRAAAPEVVMAEADGEERTHSVKVCVIGDSGVGKSAIALRFTSDMYSKDQVSTIGAALLIGRLSYGSENFKFMIWDTAGQERFNNVVPMFYRGAQAAIIVYDIASRESFENIRKWYKRTRSSGDNRIKSYVLCGNKCDLEEKRAVTPEEGRAEASEIGAEFFETSALANVNISKVFDTIARDIFNSRKSATASAVSTNERQNIIIAGSELCPPETATRRKTKKCC